jgi:hypothetical protein
MTKKWKHFFEVIEFIDDDDTLSQVDKRQIKCVTYAPNIGYHSWIFRYKGTPIVLFDAGNGHYGLESIATNIDILVARFMVFANWISIKLRKEDLK